MSKPRGAPPWHHPCVERYASSRTHLPTSGRPVSRRGRAGVFEPTAQARVGHGWGVRAERADCSLDCVPQAAQGGGGGTPSGGPTPHRHLATGRAGPRERSWRVPADRPEISRRFSPATASEDVTRRLQRSRRGWATMSPALSGFIRRFNPESVVPRFGARHEAPASVRCDRGRRLPSYNGKGMQVRHLGVGAGHTSVALALLLRGSNIRST